MIKTFNIIHKRNPGRDFTDMLSSLGNNFPSLSALQHLNIAPSHISNKKIKGTTLIKKCVYYSNIKFIYASPWVKNFTLAVSTAITSCSSVNFFQKFLSCMLFTH